MWNKETEYVNGNYSKEKSLPKSRKSKTSSVASSIGLRNSDDQNDPTVYNDVFYEASQADEDFALSISTSNHSLTTGVTPISAENINKTNSNKSSVLRENAQRSIRYEMITSLG